MLHTKNYNIPKPELSDTFDITTLHEVIDSFDTLTKNTETIRDGIVTEEATRVSNENNRVLNENTRIANEDIRKASELSRNDKEDIRESNETIRQNNENTRISQENDRVLQENSRKSAESSRVKSENTRNSNETLRQDNEELRQKNESTRQSNESNRISQENARITAENNRVSQENSRISEESKRVEQENIRITNEKNRISQENARVNAENIRISQEDIRKTNENARISEEDKRKANESTRESNEVTRQNNELNRINAEEIRNTSENLRISNENTRQDNEDIRLVNEQNREANEADRKSTINALKVYELYDNTKNYVPLNKVVYQGSCYINLIACKGVLPTDTTHWLCIAERGSDGIGVGDMLKEDYDTNNDGIVDRAEIANSVEWNNILNKPTEFGTKDYNDLINKPFIPTKTSEIINDSDLITKNYVDTEIQAIKMALDEDGDGSIIDTIADIKSQWQNADNNLKNLINNKAEGSDLTTHTENTIIHVTQADKDKWNNKSNFSGNYNDLINKPIIPTTLPANGGNADTVDGKHASDFATSDHTHDNRYYTETEINTMMNGKSNKTHTHDDRYYTEDEINSKFVSKSELSDAGYGDMLKSVYDTNGNGIVDKAEKLTNAIIISNYDTLKPDLVAQGTITPIKAPNTANSPWNNTTSGFLIQSNDVDSFHILIFRSGGDGWAYRSYYLGNWSSWKIWSTTDHNHNTQYLPKGGVTWNDLKGV